MRKNCRCLLLVLALAGCASHFDAPIGTELAERYVPPNTYAEHRAQQQLFASADGQIAYTDHGDGDVLVLLHGVPTSSWMYRNVIPGLQQHARVIAIDLLGFGSSEKPEDDGQRYASGAQAARVAALLRALGIERYGLVVHDMGGLVGWELLRSDVSAVSHLILLNTIIHEQGFEHPEFQPGMLTRQMTRAMAGNLTSGAALNMTFKSLGLTGDAALSEAECFGYVQPMREGASPALYAFYSSLNESLYARLESNRVAFESFDGATLVLWGGKDDILTTAQLPWLRTHLPIASDNVHIYPDNQHFLAEEIPAELVRQIALFLDRSR